MKRIISFIFIIGLILSFSGQGLAAINKDRFKKDRKGMSSVMGVYHARFVLDYSRAWNNPTIRYEVLRNELGLDVEYKVDKSFNSRYITENQIYNALLIDIINSDFNMFGKDYRLWVDFELDNGTRITGNVHNRRGFSTIGCNYDFLVADFNKKIEEDGSNYYPDWATFYKKKRTTIYLTIMDYLWDGIDRSRIRGRIEHPRRMR